ncbi:MAG: hypothetical protein MUC96_07880 [Myxococcaceae bacterium]|nr:hypothetical protein [Myxococcaceae bacterium]
MVVLASTLVVVPHAAGEALLAFGERLAASPSCATLANCIAPREAKDLLLHEPPPPPAVAGVRVEHRLVLAALGQPPPSPDDPAWRLEGQPLPALTFAHALLHQPLAASRPFGLERFVALRLVRQRPNRLPMLLAEVALTRRLHESWTLEARAQAAVDQWYVHDCGVGLEAAARVCFGRPLEALSAEAIAALVAHEQRAGSAERARWLLTRAGLPSGFIPTLPVPPSRPSEAEVDE